ncbi:MAG: Yip1 family protein [Candidatus Bathyarchaeia archaeon]
MSEKPGFIGQLLGVLYRPREIFSTVDEGDLTKGVVIAVLMVALAAYSTMTYMDKIPLEVITPQLQGVDAGPMAGSLGTISGIAAGVTMLVGWTFSGLILHLLGKFSGGDGSMKRYFALYGFTTVPALLNQVLRVVDASIMDSASLIGYFVSYRDMSSKVVKAFIGANLFNVWSLAGIALVVLSLEENYKVGRGRALIIALVPSLALFALNYFTG